MSIKDIIYNSNITNEFKEIAENVFSGKRINESQALSLFKTNNLGYLGILANFIREQNHGDKTFFNKNFHIEPTNICIYNCNFCSYKKKIGDPESWEFGINEILKTVEKYKNKDITEVHIVGGVHPNRDLHYYGKMIKEIKNILPNVHVKGFTAVELEFMIKKAKFNIKDGLLKLKEYGLDSIPGGGAEIFDEELRKQICDEKSSTDQWLKIHETAHSVGIPSNATILYGHIETYEHRVDHLKRLRDLQDKTNGFNTYIPLKYRKENNKMSHIGEVSTLEDLKNYAVSRIFLDNIPHLKAYWPMIGKQTTQISLSFGVDDIDGTIDDSTKIYSMAGVEDKNPKFTTEQLIKFIKDSNRIPIERDSVYNIIREY